MKKILSSILLSLFAVAPVMGQINIIAEKAGHQEGSQLGWSVAGIADQDSDGVADYAVGTPIEGMVYILSGADNSIIYSLSGGGSEAFGQTLSSKGNLLLVGSLAGVTLYENGNYKFDIQGYEWGEFVGSNIAVGDYANGALASGINGSILYTTGSYGTSACPVGDVDADNVEDFAISSLSVYGSGRGSVNVLSGVDGSVIHHLYGLQSSQFGYDLAYMGDKKFAVASRVDDGNGLNSGAVYVYSAISSNMLFVTYGNTGEQMGWSVANVGDLDGDGKDEILAGSAVNSGKVFLLSGNNGDVLAEFSGNSTFDNLGYSVSGISDGVFAFGAPGANDVFSIGTGKVYLAGYIGTSGVSNTISPISPSKGKGKGKGKGKKK
jgi:hypothetical protein